MRIRSITGAVAALSIFLLGASREGSQELPEYVVKAGFLFNFAKYVEWPADAFDDAKAPIRIGIAGEDPFGETIDRTLKDKTVNTRPFTIERFKDSAELKRCHILFVARSEKPRLPAVLERARKWPVLTVGEDKGFAQAGGVVTILIDDGKPKLEINTEAALAQKVTISSKLLKVATLVRTEK